MNIGPRMLRVHWFGVGLAVALLFGSLAIQSHGRAEGGQRRIGRDSERVERRGVATGTAVAKLDPRSHMRYANGAIAGDFTLMGMFKLSVDRDVFSTFIIMGGPANPMQLFRNSVSVSTDDDGTRFRIQGNNNTPSILGPNLNVGEWYHVALVGNTTPGSQLLGYLNGELVAVGNSNPTGTYVPEMLEIAGCWGQDIYRLAGSFCALKVWDVKLTQAEIQTEKDFYRAARRTSLWQEVPLRNVNDTLDLSGNERHLFTSGPSFGNDEQGPAIAFESDQDCSELDDQCNVGVFNGATNSCEAEPVADGTSCDDGLYCTVEDECVSGVCGGVDRVCGGPVSACNTRGCNEDSDACEDEPVANGSPCNDGSVCTEGEACVNGVCSGGTTPDCSFFGDECNGFSCDPAGSAGNCDTLTLLDGATCDDDLYCTLTDRCTAGVCVGTGSPCLGQCDEVADSCYECANPQDCDDGVNCTESFCIFGACIHVPMNSYCLDDGLFCNGTETCDELLGCTSTGNPCPDQACDESTNSCDDCLVDQDCDDGNPCTLGEQCLLGLCDAGDPVDCSLEGDQCNAASCDPSGAVGNCDVVTPLENNTPCDDEDSCNSNDRCTNGSCQGEPHFGLDEWNFFSECLDGPGVASQVECACFDYNDDGFVDLLDVALFQSLFDGQ